MQALFVAYLADMTVETTDQERETDSALIPPPQASGQPERFSSASRAWRAAPRAYRWRDCCWYSSSKLSLGSELKIWLRLNV